MSTKDDLTTVTFSVTRSMKDDIDRRAVEEGKSKSDLFREMYPYYKFK